MVPARLWKDGGGRDICIALNICQAGGVGDQHVVGGGLHVVGGGLHVVGGQQVVGSRHIVGVGGGQHIVGGGG